MKYCRICKKQQKAGHGSFFRVPKDDRRLMWSKICGIDFSKHAVVCMDHFESSSVIKSARNNFLLPNAVPIKNINVAAPKDPENIVSEIPKDTVTLLNFNNNVLPPHLQEEPIMPLPVIKSVYCTGSTQTNTRLCGLVQVSGYSYEFRFNCFYCYEVFPLENWKNFVNHLKEKHSEIEEAFKMLKYVSDDHDYTPINLNLSAPVGAPIENVVIKAESPPFLEDPLEPTYNPFESVVFNPNCYYAPDEETSIPNNINSLNNFIETDSPTVTAVSGMTNKLQNSKKESIICSSSKHKRNDSKQTSNKTALSRCLKRTNNLEVINPEDKEEYTSVSIEIVQQKPTEITLEYTTRDIVDLLLDSMKNYPLLWQFDAEPFNEDFYEAVEDLCKIINDNWSLNIDNLKMRRSINRILRFYCYLYPNANVENIDQFTNYYDKCASFLPSSVNEVAYARCSHCYICYRNDFDLKRHLLEEQKYLQWPYKCVQCKECFRESDEYEFHKRLPHFDEIFRCEPCNKTFVRRNIYNRHIAVYHPKEKRPEYQCDLCPKSFQTRGSLSNHKVIHGERKYKCHLCPKSYFSNSRLKLHLKSHRKEYDFICEVCGKEFFTHAALNRHMKKHTGAKVTCNICNLKLRNSSLRRHIRVVHEGSKGSSEKMRRRKVGDYSWLVKSRPLRPYQRKCEKRKYRCKICKIGFENYKLIVEHNKELHSDITKWPCKMCDTEFSHAINLKRHYRRKHNLHVIQAFKLVNENEDLNVVLDMKSEFLDDLTQNLVASRNKLDVAETNLNTAIKSDLLQDEDFFEAEKKHSSTIHDEIMKAANNNMLTQENDIDFFTEKI